MTERTSLIVIAHVAAAYDHNARVQLCARCGTLLVDNSSYDHSSSGRTSAGGQYPTAAIIERGPSWQAISLHNPQTPTCSPLRFSKEHAL
jgi:hypothetical protein